MAGGAPAAQFRLEGRVAGINGGASGIGRATVIAFAEAGAKIVIADRDAAASDALANDLNSGNRPALAFAADVSREDEVEALFETALGRFGGVDILVNNAGAALRR